MKFNQVKYSDSVKYNPAEYKSPLMPIERVNFYDDLITLLFKELTRKYAKPSKGRIVRIIKNKIKVYLKKYKL